MQEDLELSRWFLAALLVGKVFVVTAFCREELKIGSGA
jgi:hypothetical protein